jgi:hypothetical protein
MRELFKDGPGLAGLHAVAQDVALLAAQEEEEGGCETGGGLGRRWRRYLTSPPKSRAKAALKTRT